MSADILGDWREEVMYRTEDGKELRIFSTTIPTQYRFATFMHDPQYRLSIAWQNVGYNQPPHVGFYIGPDMKPAPRPNITLVTGNGSPAKTQALPPTPVLTTGKSENPVAFRASADTANRYVTTVANGGLYTSSAEITSRQTFRLTDLNAGLPTLMVANSRMAITSKFRGRRLEPSRLTGMRGKASLIGSEVSPTPNASSKSG